MHNHLVAATLLTLAPLTLIAAAPAFAATPEETLIGIEVDWSKAIVSRDANALRRIVAADWSGRNPAGQRLDRDGLIKEITGDTTKFASMHNHDVTARVIGDIALVQGMDTEISTNKGKSTGGEFSWLDVFQLRDGHWVAIASQNTPVKKAKT